MGITEQGFGSPPRVLIIEDATETDEAWRTTTSFSRTAARGIDHRKSISRRFCPPQFNASISPG